MDNVNTDKPKGKFTGLLSICVSLIAILLILNWFFEITPYQKLQGMPLMIAPFAGAVGFAAGFISYKKSPNSLAKWGMAMNALLFVIPILYWAVGTFIFGV